ncbi:transmembrane protein 14c [Plasmopara halstedii]|uniref:Transmembrane protein 14c n=1 Tax=Plasmopara halstedii TaxID=4781 RepID=A0A0N7L897_PLAHL|nr:transmembrane protein 14c [Plasmopara halstedii]CEG49267.1 transmembrane protein 14c [Plasmopara halstedii]|eukprot:XP_024585636.1 transmembrane protein 14c [Plasmopara halstedii]
MYDFCLTIPYGMLLGVGGVIGFINTGSTMSVAAGGLSGAILSFLGYCSYNEYKQSPVTSKLWPGLSLAVSTALTITMGNRYNKTNAFFPAGFLAAYSAGMSIFYVWVLTKKSKPQYKKKA